jgi:murein DD-endopeptidase MepM/ murein hydrolase activator NlpD
MKKLFLFLILFNTPLLYSQYNVMTTLFSYLPLADKIAYPVNHGTMKGYHDAKPFGTNKHLGADVNGDILGNADFGDTVFAIGKGKVIYVFQANQREDEFMSIIMILHKTKKGYIVSLYRHCQKSLVQLGDLVDYLQPISTIGNDFGLYQAHLHFEIRTNIFLDIGYGYGDPTGYIDPMKFIKDYNK